jgi:hypothetical protein
LAVQFHFGRLFFGFHYRQSIRKKEEAKISHTVDFPCVLLFREISENFAPMKNRPLMVRFSGWKLKKTGSGG